jgi:hypothetical protein
MAGLVTAALGVPKPFLDLVQIKSSILVFPPRFRSEDTCALHCEEVPSRWARGPQSARIVEEVVMHRTGIPSNRYSRRLPPSERTSQIRH